MYSDFYNADIQDAQVVAETYRAPRNAYDQKVINRIKELRTSGYGTNLMQKNTFAVRGAIVGGIVGAGSAMFFKRSVWGFSIMGILLGSVAGFGIGKLIVKYNNNKQDDSQPSL